MQARRDGSWLVDGSFLMADINLEGLHISEDASEETIGAYVVRCLGRLAYPGDRVELGSYVATVDDVRRRRVFRVTLKPLETQPDG